MDKNEAFNQLYIEYRKCREDMDKCKAIIKTMEKEYKDTDDILIKIKIYRCKAEYSYFQEDFNASEKYCDKIIKISQDSPGTLDLIQAYNIKGIINNYRGNYVEAVNCYLCGLECGDEYNIKNFKCSINNNIAYLFIELGQYENAIKFLKKSIKTIEKQGEKGSSVRDSLYINLCNCYANIDDITNLEATIKDYDTFFNYETANLKDKASYCLVKMTYYAKKADTLHVKKMYNILVDLLDNTENCKIEADVVEDMIILSKWFIEKGYIAEARKFLSIAQNNLRNYGLPEFSKKYYYAMIKLYAATGEKDKKDEMVLKYYESSEEINEQLRLINAENILNITKMYEMKRKMKQVEERANIDELTGVYNRHAFKEYFNRKFRKACEYNYNVGIAFIDVDEFKKYNDNYGHHEGDNCLKFVAREIKKLCTDKNILPLRYGGDEFLIMFINKDNDSIIAGLKQMRDKVYNSNYENKGSKKGRLTVSIGVIVKEAKYSDDIHEYVIAADRALYRGKEEKNSMDVVYTL